ncbi:Nca2p NDAI_0B05930 [Naumovozyma dairenensis CBS 421]|uniref:Nuclear control of ATPase protein 2 n=1 Tax=Naumovozyma dairenensis (strain ATCC 10597 / BCRC 20456 / CBS 421 / NBRC 0211 / NRRL Y-12639) TaxID=1071378 RepID=G0W764_NAUDC|nr:hypothetical protein NDAI_0B05930 [Naumovozyma dairenensis CBS 421]CCD23625.1 hypothetical protein NDAI_0B05930 [Naumovozyma dairenensis CBS 421]
MIFDNAIKSIFQDIDTELESVLKQETQFENKNLRAPTEKDDGDNVSIEDLTVLQNQLQTVKDIVAQLIKTIDKRNNSNNNSNEKLNIPYAKLSEISQNRDIYQNHRKPSLLPYKITKIIEKYIITICFYVILNETLNALAIAYDTQKYYKTLEKSLLWMAIYGIQHSIPKLYSFTTNIIKDIPPLSPSSSSSYLAKQRNNFNPSNVILKVKPSIHKLFMIRGFQIVGSVPSFYNDTINFTKLILNLPQWIIKQDIIDKIQLIDSGLNHWTSSFGELINHFFANNSSSAIPSITTLSNFLPSDKDVTNNDDSLQNLVIKTQLFQKENQLKSIRKPNILTRYWPTLLLTLLYGPNSVNLIWNHRDDILRFINENIFQFINGLIKNWIWIPLQNIWATVKHDDSSSMAMISKGSLDSEMNSLTRMIVSFVLENSATQSPSPENTIDTESLVREVEHGDLTRFMELYENQLHHPLKNIVSGKLIRSILIQVQKTKVDGSMALNGIDKMLQSQQLVFGVVAMSPAVLIVYFLTNSIVKFIKMGNIWSRLQHTKDALSISLNNVERILNNIANAQKTNEDHNETMFYKQGLLTLEVSNMYNFGKAVIPSSRKKEWIRDVEEILSNDLNYIGKLQVIKRIYHAYGKYF